MASYWSCSEDDGSWPTHIGKRIGQCDGVVSNQLIVCNKINIFQILLTHM